MFLFLHRLAAVRSVSAPPNERQQIYWNKRDRENRQTDDRGRDAERKAHLGSGSQSPFPGEGAGGGKARPVAPPSRRK